MADAMIWDGEAFRAVPHEEADRLVALDLAQNIRGLTGLQLKTKAQFTGHSGRDPQEDPVSKAVQKTPLKPWLSYRKAAAEHLGKTYNATTKADVDRYLELLDTGKV